MNKWMRSSMSDPAVALMLAWTFLGPLAAVGRAAASCGDMASFALKGGMITSAVIVESGRFAPPVGARSEAIRTFQELPAFCRVSATLKPSEDSDIKIEVWMPASGWNGKFQAVGNGGWAGSIDYSAMAGALSQGYATSGTDTGHQGGNGTFVQGHPEKFVDFAYRSVHEMTVQAKAIIAAFYGTIPKYSYWNGCSTGGRQGLKEAQRYPSDYDGIIAGAPVYYWTHLKAAQTWPYTVMHATPESLITKPKYAVLHQAVLQACDALDGVKDGLIENPLRCRFDPGVLACQGADAPSCLTPAQVKAARKIYAPLTNPRTKEEIFPAPAPGSEIGWGDFSEQPGALTTDYYKYVVFRNPDWDWRTLDYDKDVALSDKIDGGMANATDPNLKEFFGRGGKLLIYHGWNDPGLSPVISIQYVERVRQAMGGADAVDGSLRLFLVPGMGHCGGGEGPNVFDKVGALTQWVEKGEAPQSIVASHSAGGKTDRTRPLCPYPQQAVYRGTGSVDDAANFTCAVK
jgi:feruloyl esterase